MCTIRIDNVGVHVCICGCKCGCVCICVCVCACMHVHVWLAKPSVTAAEVRSVSLRAGDQAVPLPFLSSVIRCGDLHLFFPSKGKRNASLVTGFHNDL